MPSPNGDTFRAAIWAAVSSKAQATDAHESLPHQLEQGRQACARFGWRVVRELSVPGHSREYASLDAALRDIPPLAELIDLARARQINLLVCYDLNRFRGLQAPVVKTLAGYGVQTYPVNQPITLVPPAEFAYYRSDDLAIKSHVGALLSDTQLNALRRSYETGMPARVERQGLHQNNSLPYGYRRPDGHAFDPKAVLVPEPAAAIMLRDMKARYERGESANSIARALNAAGLPGPRGGSWSERVVLYLLTNPWYAGCTVRRRTRTQRDVMSRKVRVIYLPEREWVLAPGRHEPLWTRAEWESLCALRHQRAQRKAGRTRHTRFFSHLLICSLCGARLTVGSVRRGTRVLICPGGALREGHARAYEADVVVQLRGVLASIGADVPETAPADHAAEVARTEAAMAANAAARANAQRLAVRQLLSDDDLAARQTELAAERAQLEAKLVHYRGSEQRAALQAAARSEAADLAAHYDDFWGHPPDAVNARLLRIFDGLLVTGTKITDAFLRGALIVYP